MTAGSRPDTEHPFDQDTRVVASANGHFDARLSDRWNALAGVNGGYCVAVCLRALREVMPHPDPLAVSTFFLRGGSSGDVEIHTDIGRQGRRTSVGEARMYQGGKELVRTTATFVDLGQSQGATAMLATKPDLPTPEEGIDPLADMSLSGLTIADQVEFRYSTPPGWGRGEPDCDPNAEFWMRFKGGRDADPFSLPLLVDAAAPVVLDLGVTASTTLQLTTHVRARPAPGWLACRVATRYLIDGYHEEDFEIWDAEGNLVAQARQLALVSTG